MSEPSVEPRWFTVRCIFQTPSDGGSLYEERLTLWQAENFHHAIALAEKEAEGYARANGVKYVGLAQACLLAEPDPPVSGSEVFSLVRESRLSPTDYLDGFFATGEERQGRAEKG
ncbi:MAG: hypothetical protein ABSD97_03950 [Acidimicrobiales bacterium]